MRYFLKLIKSILLICNCLIIILCSLFIFGCAGSKSFIEAPTVKYPVSLSGSVRNTDGNILFKDEFEVVGIFTYKYKTVHMLWKTIPLTKVKQDILDELSKQIKEANGEAIINLEIFSYENHWNVWAALLSLGVLPGYCTVEVKGDIVRRKIVNDHP